MSRTYLVQKVEGLLLKKKRWTIGSDRIGPDRASPPEGETARDRSWAELERWAEWAELLGWTCEEREFGRGPLTQGGRGLRRTAAMAPRAMALAPRRRDDGPRGDSRALSLVVRLWVCLAKLMCAPFRALHPDRDYDLSNETDIRPLGGRLPGTVHSDILLRPPRIGFDRTSRFL
ncbi:hypothetical protein CRG98_031793 [Punica granatum]|uniref:Uncharacterized protein n=1 Tax=Punica granatum TaxID=22663 RepID=A0A2I0IV06_PUNGR|nr:hypothetical protein CRG98_031793 [Punica granatum]